MERISRLIVVASMLLGGVAYAVFAGQVLTALPWAAAAAFGVTFGLARFSVPLALAPALLLAYVFPAAAMAAFGATDYRYHYILVWLAALAGPIVAASDWTRWHVPVSWRLPLAAWAVVVAITWPIVAAREVDFSWIALGALDTPNGLQGGPPALTAAWVTSVALGLLVGIAWIDLFWQRFAAERLRDAERLVLPPLLGSIALSSLAGLYQRYVDINWLNPGDWPSLQRASGLMLDANSFGTAAAMWAPAAIALAWRLERDARLGALMSMVLLGGLWVSGSRTALLVGIAGLIGVAIAAGARARVWQARLAPVALLFAAGVVVLAAAVQSRDASNPLTRLVQNLPRGEGSLQRVGEVLWVRDGYGIAAMRAIAEHPWAGVGVGAFNPLAPDYFYLATGGHIPPDNAQNWWRHQVAELGLAGAAPSLAFSLVALWLIWKAPASGDRQAPATVLRAVLAGVGAACLVGVSTQHPALWVTFATMLCWLGALVEAPALTSQRAAAVSPAWVAVPVVALAVAAGLAWSARHDLRVPMRAVRVGFPYSYGFSSVSRDPVHGDVRWTGSHAVGVPRAEHAYFELTAWPQAADLPADPVRVRLWRGSQLVADVEATSSAPITRILRVPVPQRYLMVEADVSRTADDGRGLRIAGRWLREVPPGAPPTVVVP